MRSLADAIAAVALTLWVGGLWLTGLVVAPVLFAGLERPVAGMIAGRLFSAVAWLGLACGASLLLHRFVTSGAQALRQPPFWIVAVMVVLVAIGHFGLQPVMETLLAQGAGEAARGRFAALHTVARTLYAVVSVLGLAAVVLAARERNRRS